jgi:thiol:disulfide interchange protein
MIYKRLGTLALIFTLLGAFFASAPIRADALDDLLNQGANRSSTTDNTSSAASIVSGSLKDVTQEFSLGDVASDEAFLPVEQAYQLTVSRLGSNNGLELSWFIADKYYLYGEQFKVSINNQRIEVNLPIGVTEYDQTFEKDVEKHYRQAIVSIDQDQLPKHQGYELTVISQGCADAGLCYPPQTERFSIDSAGISPVIFDDSNSNRLNNNSADTKVDEDVIGVNVSMATIFYMIAFALIGGALLNLMPCVLPVLAIKALALTNSKTNHRIQGWSYTMGAITTFVIIATLLLVIRAAGQAVGWGFQLQSPGFVTILFYLFLVMGLSLSGLVSFGARWMSAGQNLTQGSGLSQSYFTGVLAAVVASPCTAPFMAPALGFAITQPWSIALLIFASLGFGMALPLLLLSYTPALNKFLPKPGTWMETFKQALAFPLYITAIWLLWVLSRQLGPNITALIIFGGLAIVFIYWLGQKSKRFFPATGLIAIIIVTVMSWHTSRQEPLLASISTANSLTWEAYNEERLASLRDAGKAVFINLTADWCITCLANEQVVFTDSTLAIMRAKNITLLKGDWTNYDPQITKLLEKYKRGGVPLYLLFPAEINKAPIILSQILTPNGFSDAINEI